MTLGSELREAWEGLGDGWIWITSGGLEEIGGERGGEDGDGDLGDRDREGLRPSLALVERSLECRLPVGGLTNFEKKPGAISSITALYSIKGSVVVSAFSAYSLELQRGR